MSGGVDYLEYLKTVSKKKKMSLIVKVIAFLGVIGCVMGLIVVYALLADEPQKIDGTLYFEIEGYRLSKYLGHKEILDFCRIEHENFDCNEMFEGCGAVNCICKIKKG